MRRFLELAPYVVPIVTVLLGAIFGPSIRSVARHRRDLGADAAIVEALPEKAKEALRDDMGRRAMELIAYSRYPTLTVSDLFALTAFLASAVYFGWITIDFAGHGWAVDPVGVVISWSLLSVFMLTSWVTFHTRWTLRAAARLRALRDDVGQHAAEESGRLLRVASQASRLGGAMLIGAGVPTSVFVALAAWYDWMPGSDALGYGLLATALVATVGVIGLGVMVGGELEQLLIEMFNRDEFNRYAEADARRKAKREQRRAAKDARRHTSSSVSPAKPDDNAPPNDVGLLMVLTLLLWRRRVRRQIGE